MSEKFKEGTRLGTMLNGEVEIVKWLAEGGQGDVYVVKYNGEEKALKWYKPNGTGKDKEAFYENLKENVIRKSPSPEFLWPLDIAEEQDDQKKSFGYIMNLRPEGYYELSEYMLTHVRFSSYRIVTNAALHIVSAYRILHNKGYSYQDLNDGNFFINPKSGDVLICDNDNVAPDGVQTGIIGKPRYMAPEIVRREKMPDNESDLFSMSVIVFLLYFLNHPLEGKRSLAPAMTPKLQTELYGNNPLFIMDKENKANEPDPLIHKNILDVWPDMPDYMQELFSDAFSQKALKVPAARPMELEWLKRLVRFQNSIIPCTCGNEIFVQDESVCICRKCGKKWKIPYRLMLKDYSVPAIPGNKLYRFQLETCKADETLQIVGRVIAKKTDVLMLGLQNCGENIWNVTTPSGKLKKVGPGEVVPLKDGLSFTVMGFNCDSIIIKEV